MECVNLGKASLGNEEDLVSGDVPCSTVGHDIEGLPEQHASPDTFLSKAMSNLHISQAATADQQSRAEATHGEETNQYKTAQETAEPGLDPYAEDALRDDDTMSGGDFPNQVESVDAMEDLMDFVTELDNPVLPDTSGKQEDLLQFDSGAIVEARRYDGGAAAEENTAEADATATTIVYGTEDGILYIGTLETSLTQDKTGEKHCGTLASGDVEENPLESVVADDIAVLSTLEAQKRVGNQLGGLSSVAYTTEANSSTCNADLDAHQSDIA